LGISPALPYHRRHATRCGNTSVGANCRHNTIKAGGGDPCERPNWKGLRLTGADPTNPKPPDTSSSTVPRRPLQTNHTEPGRAESRRRHAPQGDNDCYRSSLAKYLKRDSAVIGKHNLVRLLRERDQTISASDRHLPLSGWRPDCHSECSSPSSILRPSPDHSSCHGYA